MTNQTRVLVVDDQPVIRDGLMKIINSESDMTVVDTATGVDVVGKAVTLKPDVIIMDIIMPGVNGLQVVPQIKDKLPDTKLIMFTISDNEEDLFTSLESGAHGYLLKSSSIDQITDGVRKVVAGETILSPRMAGKLAADVKHKNEKRKLSARESEIFGYICDGLSNIEIAHRLSLEESTVKTHIHHLLGKLNVKNRTEATFLSRRCLL